MKPSLQHIGTRWSALAPRERQAVTLAAAVLILALLWLGLLRPSLRTLEHVPAEIAQLQAQLRTVRRQADALMRLGSAPSAPHANIELRGTVLDWLHQHAPDARVEITVLPAGATLQVQGLRPKALLALARVARHDWGSTLSAAKLRRIGDGFDGSVQLTRDAP